MKVMVYTRPRIKVFFHELVKNIACFTEILFISDHKGEESIAIMDYYYRAKKEFLKGLAYPKIRLDEKAIIRRCRYLRSLKASKAKIKVKSMTLAVERLIAEYQPDLVFGMVMDSFVLDIIDLVMRQRNSQYLGFLNNMVNGYSRLTGRGELISLQSVKDSAVDQALTQLKVSNYLPNMQKDFMWKTTPLSMFINKYLKEKIKIAYYFFKKWWNKDPDNFYYNTVAAKSCMSCHTLDQLFFRRFETFDWQAKLQKAKDLQQLIVYLPLQFYPECSIDYWGTHSEFAAFYQVMQKIIDNTYHQVIFLIKEHPSAMGLRQSEFYRSIVSNPKLILMPFNLSSNEVIKQADLVLTWTGSVGIEALMRAKPLVTFGKAYYDPGFGILSLQSFAELSNLETILLDYYQAFDLDFVSYQKEILNYLLKGLVPGYIFPLDYLTKKNPKNNRQMAKLSQAINKAILKIQAMGNYPVRTGCV